MLLLLSMMLVSAVAVMLLSSMAVCRLRTLGEEVESVREALLVSCRVVVAVTSINTSLCIEHLGKLH